MTKVLDHNKRVFVQHPRVIESFRSFPALLKSNNVNIGLGIGSYGILGVHLFLILVEDCVIINFAELK